MKKKVIWVTALLLVIVLIMEVKIFFSPPKEEIEVFSIEEYPIEIPVKEVIEEPKEVEPTQEIFVPYAYIPLREDLQVHLNELCKENDLDFFLCAALMESESSFIEGSVSKDGKDIGLYQIRASVWEDYFNEMGLDIYDSEDNIECGIYILKSLTDKYPIETALQCYKCGEPRGLELEEEGIMLEVIKTIMDRQEEWQRKEP